MEREVEVEDVGHPLWQKVVVVVVVGEGLGLILFEEAEAEAGGEGGLNFLRLVHFVEIGLFWVGSSFWTGLYISSYVPEATNLMHLPSKL